MALPADFPKEFYRGKPAAIALDFFVDLAKTTPFNVMSHTITFQVYEPYRSEPVLEIPLTSYDTNKAQGTVTAAQTSALKAMKYRSQLVYTLGGSPGIWTRGALLVSDVYVETTDS
jgi:hypothetical protein